MAKSGKETPLMKQYFAIKAKHPGALLLFRVGDFYETFGEDAITTSQILDIVLTKRSNGAAAAVELAGFPHHALDSYLPKLVRAGHRVAICDQLEDPKAAKGIVKRGVTELVTPGVSLNDHVLDKNRNNFLASVEPSGNRAGIALLDISTGEFMAAEGSFQYVDNLLKSFRPSEVIYSKAKKKEAAPLLDDGFSRFTPEEWVFQYDYAYEKLLTHFGTASLKGFGIEDQKLGIIAAGAILHYLHETEHRELAHIHSLSRIEEEQYVWLDKFTIRNLELVYPQHDGGVPLIDILDKTITPMGSRMLRKWVVMPLKNLEEIQQRHQSVEALLNQMTLSDKVEDLLKPIGDLARMVSKLAVKRINPREMLMLLRSLKPLPDLRSALLSSKTDHLKSIGDRLNSCELLTEKIAFTIKDEVPLQATQGGIIREGVDEKLDELRKISFSGKDYLAGLQKREMERTGISSLKIAFNRVFGYYLEVTNAHKDKVPQEWIRKQTLVNAERYITQELKEYEEKILNSEEKILEIESRLYQQLIEFAQEYVQSLQENAHLIGQLDCLRSFSVAASKNGYCKPEMNHSHQLNIVSGRHPVIEQMMPPGEDYIPNDILLDNEKQQILIITGPNMAGKSALLRQTALITLMAQMGCYVPAKEATLGWVDKVFTRVGASDNLSRGESTFMVEMTETASILNNLSNRSLILMDEVGRGTSTYDGVSIAFSIVEYLQGHKHRPKTLFATHYHELNQLEEALEGIKNFNVSVKEIGDKIIFMRKLKAGGSEHSFGIHVAQIAGMPNPVVLRAHEIMQHLEKDHIADGNSKRLKNIPAKEFQLNLFDSDPKVKALLDALNNVDINTLSPVEALLKLNELKNLLKSTN